MLLYNDCMENKTILIGSRWNNWVVVELPENINGSIYFKCRCDCGTVRDVCGSRLRLGTSKSCGCSRRNIGRARLNDLTGKVFGKLTVIERSENSCRGRATWKCVCACGNTSIVLSGNLVSGNTGSCGCALKTREIVRPDSVREKVSAKRMNRYRSDSKFNINSRISNAIKASLRNRGEVRKSCRWSDLVGYSVESLKASLEKTMPLGFTWEDFLEGEIEIDHIVPLAAHNYSAEGDLDFKRAWALTNLRLLPTADNRRKKDRLLAPFQPSLGF